MKCYLRLHPLAQATTENVSGIPEASCVPFPKPSKKELYADFHYHGLVLIVL